MKHLTSFISKMEKSGISPIVIETFGYYYEKIVAGETGLIPGRDIRPPDPDEVTDSETLGDYAEAGRKFLDNAVRITLNGGLGTSMGLTKAKSLLEVKDGRTFLDIIVEKAEKSGVRLALMNSFSTHDDTLAALSDMNLSRFPMTFLQHKFPKILQENFAPAQWPQNEELEWNPPGHGDIYTALHTSGMLGQLLDAGIRYAFISNSDNLGADLDTSLLGYFAGKQFPFMMEVSDRTPADAKGGHLARHKNGRLILRESAQCPDDELDAFRDIKRYGFFNTNNLWVNLEFLRKLIEEEKTVRLPMILNPKTLNPRDKTSPKVFQAETAMGAAISLFEGAVAVKVPRTRFFPVKKCSDLLFIRSDCFRLRHGDLILNPNRTRDSMKIRLDPAHYAKIDQFDARFKAVPSLTDCESLSVEGDVLFEKNVIIRGNVIIRNTGTAQAIVREGSVVEGETELNCP